VPRDLWVDYGQACTSGYQGKINVTYICNANTDSKGKPQNEAAGQTAFRTQVGNIFGIDLQYSVHINYTVLQKAVDAVGGITVNIDSPDPRGILDRNFDWNCPGGRPQSCYNVKYPNGPANLDGLHALYLARARGDDPQGRTYGLGNANFDREKYQQKILIALKEKATSAGTLANPVAVTNILDALGGNVRTNIDSEEVKSFIALLKDTDASKMKTLTLVDKTKPLVTTGTAGGQSIVRPVAGLFDYSAIQTYVRANISGDQTATEAATVAVLNGSGVVGGAQKRADTLKTQGIVVDSVANAPAGAYPNPVTLYDMTGGKKPATKDKLEKILGVKTTTSALPSTVTSKADFVIILGTNGAN
jgi:anionic cell wall polymer biosynthesis LytR-Cps2A-Psr (LCP) family protein